MGKIAFQQLIAVATVSALAAFPGAAETAPPKDPVCPWPPSLDAVAAAPETHRVLFENDEVRVLDVVVPPKAKEPVHAHCWPSVVYYMSMKTFVVYNGKGKVLFDSRTAPPQFVPFVEWLDPQAPHAIENLSDEPLHLVATELKR